MLAYEFFTSRRQFLNQLGVATAAVALSDLFIPGVFAEELTRTPAQGEGPFYPDKLPLDTDNDLVIVNNSVTPAVGEITHLSGRILNSRGEPVRNAMIEIWQVDNNGCYIHSQGAGGRERDGNFQGYGRFETGSTGEYRFRTIKPVVYSSRPPHIHIKVRAGREELTTQCYVKNHSSTETDWLIRGIRDPKARAALMAEFVPVRGSRIGELAAKFDIVLGFTPSV
ncbi:MAG: twin-arginine translocation signal domain-containing protein [Acidobacteriales bacterium]|nr:twin-arginine translocation signal domain-containing protein [Terriglobales bacterium]